MSCCIHEKKATVTAAARTNHFRSIAMTAPCSLEAGAHIGPSF